MKQRERSEIARAIICIHSHAMYYKGMDILCKLIGWPALSNPFEAKAEMVKASRKFNRWIKSEAEKGVPV